MQDSVTGRIRMICFNETGRGKKSVSRISVSEGSEVFLWHTAPEGIQTDSQRQGRSGLIHDKSHKERSKSIGTRKGQARSQSQRSAQIINTEAREESR